MHINDIIKPENQRDLDFTAEAEPACKYVMEDGSVLRARLLLMHIIIDPNDAYNPDGTLRYMCQFQQVLDVIPSETAKQAYRRGPSANPA